jgi:hypothetical protein
VDTAGFPPHIQSKIYNELDIYLTKNANVFDEAFGQKIKRTFLDIFLPIPILNGLISVSINTDLDLQSLNSNIYSPLFNRTYPEIQANPVLKYMFYDLATNIEVLAMNINTPSSKSKQKLQYSAFDTFFNEKNINSPEYHLIKSNLKLA